MPHNHTNYPELEDQKHDRNVFLSQIGYPAPQWKLLDHRGDIIGVLAYTGYKHLLSHRVNW